MHWLGNVSFSSYSSTTQKRRSPHGDFRNRVHLTPRLTRQKNLRYLSDEEIASALQSHQSDGLPLPLPELAPVRRKEEGDCPLPSPEQARVGREKWDGGGAAGEGSSSLGCFSAHQAGRKIAEAIDTRSTLTIFQELKRVENSKDKFQLDVPGRSAHTVTFSSPMFSPQRLSSDLYPHYLASPQRNQIWSAPEIPTSIPSPTLTEYSYKIYSTDSPPLQSPHVKSPCLNRGIGVPLSPVHPRSYFDTATVRRESTTHVGVHPLPLPPVVVGAAPSTPNSHVPSKPEPMQLNSQWQKGKLIGRGTFGSVYVAFNRETGALCAMKEVELFPDDPKSTECMKQMEQEIKVLSHLKHPNIVQYYGSEIVEDRFYIYLEYVHPGSINKYVRDHVGAITESVVRNFTRHILSGLAYLHSKKTIHRDIKGANLLVDASGVVKLADFGMAKHLSGQAANLSLKGSPYWMAPELMQAVMQKDNSSDLALAVDIWSLGCTIIEMLTGKPPWSEYEGAAAMFKVLRETPPIPKTLSAEGKEFLQCCFQRNPAERPSASTLLEHPFLRNSQQLVPSCRQALTGMKLTEAHERGRDLSRHSVDLLQCSGYQSLHSMDMLPSVQKTGSETSDREDVCQSHETPNLTMPSHYSPCSILETVPSSSPIHLVVRQAI